MHWLWLLSRHCLPPGPTRGSGTVLAMPLPGPSAPALGGLRLPGALQCCPQLGHCPCRGHLLGCAAVPVPPAPVLGMVPVPAPHPRSVRFSQSLMEIFVPSL